MLAVDIKALVRRLIRSFLPEDDVTIFEEFQLAPYGRAYADMAVCDDEEWCGYEIKSASDSLKRLPAQMVHYGRIFDRCTLIAAPKHLELATALLPAWWCITELRINATFDESKLRVVREGGRNPSIDSKAIAKLLRRAEADAILLNAGIFAPLRRGSRKAFGEAVHSMIPLPTLKAAVVAAVAARGGGTGHGL